MPVVDAYGDEVADAQQWQLRSGRLASRHCKGEAGHSEGAGATHRSLGEADQHGSESKQRPLHGAEPGEAHEGFRSSTSWAIAWGDWPTLVISYETPGQGAIEEGGRCRFERHFVECAVRP